MTLALLNPHQHAAALGSGIGAFLLATLEDLEAPSGDDAGFLQWAANWHTQGLDWTLLAVKSSTVSFNLRSFREGDPVHIWWGDGTTEVVYPPETGVLEVSHDYGSSDRRGVSMLGAISRISTDSGSVGLWETRANLLPNNLSSLRVGSGVIINGDTADLPRNLGVLRMESGSTGISGDVANFPANLYWLTLDGDNDVTGDAADMPVGMQHLRLQGGTTISGNLADLPESLYHLFVTGSNTLTGAVTDLSPNLEFLYLAGNALVTGDISDFPLSLTEVQISGASVLTGDIATLKEGLTRFIISAGNTLYGDVANLPSTLTYFDVNGDNTISGDVGDVPSGLTHLDVSGSNTITGNVSGLPAGLEQLALTGNNTVTGNVSGLPSTLEYMYVLGNNTLSGDVVGLPAGMDYLQIGGQNTVSGVIADLPVGLTSVGLSGGTTISGDLSDLPAPTRLIYLISPGPFMVSGGLPTGLSSVYISSTMDVTNVDAFLAAMWANRDEPKPSSTRSINLARPNMAGPSDLTVVTDLREYRSPGDLPQYSAWTVSVNDPLPPVVVPEVVEQVGSMQLNSEPLNEDVHEFDFNLTSEEQDGSTILLLWGAWDDANEVITSLPTNAVEGPYVSVVDGAKGWLGVMEPTSGDFSSGTVHIAFTLESEEQGYTGAIELIGVDLSDPIGDQVVDESNADRTSVGPSTLTVDKDGSMIVVLCVVDTDGGQPAMTTANGFTEISAQDPHIGYCLAIKEDCAAGDHDTPIFSGAGETHVVAMVINPAEGTGGGGEEPEPEPEATVSSFTDAEVTYAESTSIVKAVPTFEVGDLLLAAVMHRSALTPASGWTLVDTQAEGEGSGASQVLSVYSRVAEAGDDEFTWSQASSERMAVGYVVSRATSGAVVVESSASSGSQAATNPYEHPLPTVTVTIPGSRAVAFSACVYSTSSVRPYSAPLDWTQHASETEGDNRLAMASRRIDTAGAVSGAVMNHDGFNTHSGSEIVVVLAPDEGTPVDELFIVLQAEDLL